MTDMQDLFEPKQIKAKKGLFEIVQAVVTQLGDYSYVLPKGLQLSYYPEVGFSKNEIGVDRKYVFQKQGLKAVVEFAFDKKEYKATTQVSVEANGKNVYGEIRSLYESIVKAYEPGNWEKQIWKLYEDALHMKAARQARRDILKQKIKSAGDRRSASLW